MTQDEYEVGSLEDAEKFAIIRIAREAGIAHAAGIYMEHLERFAALVAAHEREACAKVCDEPSYMQQRAKTSAECAAAIRARGETK